MTPASSSRASHWPGSFISPLICRKTEVLLEALSLLKGFITNDK